MSHAPTILPSVPKSAAAPRPAGGEATSYDPACAVFRRHLRGEKLKFTPERAMILDAVLQQEGLFEPDRLADGLRGLGHRVSRATLYRTLSHLQAAGILRQTHFDGRRGYYEVVVGRRTHDHLICVETGEVVAFDSEPLRRLRDAICAEHGFDPVGHQFHVYGLGPRARRTAAPVDLPVAGPSAQGGEGGEGE